MLLFVTMSNEALASYKEQSLQIIYSYKLLTQNMDNTKTDLVQVL